jgi:hypothetical protein
MRDNHRIIANLSKTAEHENHRFIRCIFWLEFSIVSPEFPEAVEWLRSSRFHRPCSANTSETSSPFASCSAAIGRVSMRVITRLNGAQFVRDCQVFRVAPRIFPARLHSRGRCASRATLVRRNATITTVFSEHDAQIRVALRDRARRNKPL